MRAPEQGYKADHPQIGPKWTKSVQARTSQFPMKDAHLKPRRQFFVGYIASRLSPYFTSWDKNRHGFTQAGELMIHKLTQPKVHLAAVTRTNAEVMSTSSHPNRWFVFRKNLVRKRKQSISAVMARRSQVTICSIGFKFESVMTIPCGGVGGATSSEARRKADGIATDAVYVRSRNDEPRDRLRTSDGGSDMGRAEKPQGFPRRCVSRNKRKQLSRVK